MLSAILSEKNYPSITKNMSFQEESLKTFLLAFSYDKFDLEGTLMVCIFNLFLMMMERREGTEGGY